MLSVTFNHPDTNSKALQEYGWRRTPYAYLLLQPRGPEVDKIPPLRLDLDFLDTSGYAIIPVESSVIPIDAKTVGEARPSEKLQLVQTLDERQAENGALILEIKATAHGLVPKLNDLLDLQQDNFEVVDMEDQGLAVSQFEKDSEEPSVVSERLWTVKMQANTSDQKASVFTFPISTLADTEVTLQRYDDADLVESEATVELAGQYSKPSYAWIWALPFIVVGLAIAAFVLIRSSGSKPQDQQTSRFKMPDEVTPFSVLGLLRRIETNNGLQPNQRKELLSSIQRLESHFFDAPDKTEPNLEQIARDWIRQAK